jgi:hypothetical protein
MADLDAGTTGLADPVPVTPARRPGSVRRTSHIDMIFPPGGGLRLEGAARDLRTPPTATAPAGAPLGEVVGAAEVSARLDAGHVLRELRTTPPEAGVRELVGLVARKGFRQAVARALPGDEASPLHLLLDDIPVAALISGYALLYRGLTGIRDPAEAHVRVDLCSGWRSDGTMMASIRTSGTIPVPLGPPANELAPADDPLAWHPVGPLPAGAMRRRRLVEVRPGDPCEVWAMFRDTHTDEHGLETVLHEYSLTATLDAASMRLLSCTATPQVLPWTECPQAAASAARLAGRRVDEVRDLVAREFKGTTTCTHLNDLLRSLAGLAALVPHLAGPAPDGAAGGHRPGAREQIP